MKIEKLVADVLEDLDTVSDSEPNEKLPKEEQVRSRIYASLLNDFEFVCVERNYFPVEDKSNIECDIWAKDSSSTALWLELKRCWSCKGKGWVPKPPEQLRKWNEDVAKLSKVESKDNRYFFLVGVFDSNPLGEHKDRVPGVIKNIRNFYPDNLVYKVSRKFKWRNTNLSHIGAWVWHWKAGDDIAITNRSS